jgi:uncharacterized protein (DUF924 family)
MNYQDFLDFWFSPAAEPNWFVKSAEFDALLAEKFTDVLQQAAQGELWTWRETPAGRLAEIIVLDQLSRNLYRNNPRAFAQDGMALVLAQEMIHLKLDQDLNPTERRFLYMPFMHSESKRIHEVALTLFESLNDPTVLGYELKHKVIIDRFGRYPHRNQVLGRPSSAEELEFLTQPNSSF